MNNPNIEESIKEIVIDVLDIDDLNSFEFNEFSKIDDFAEWDSLAHLSILMELEKIFPNKITSITEIAEANSYKKLEKILLSKKLLKND